MKTFTCTKQQAIEAIEQADRFTVGNWIREFPGTKYEKAGPPCGCAVGTIALALSDDPHAVIDGLVTLSDCEDETDGEDHPLFTLSDAFERTGYRGIIETGDGVEYLKKVSTDHIRLEWPDEVTLEIPEDDSK